ncbi:hypothetical protein KAJ87_03445 [Candidatus Pacearchaeota archaeon]|nr:hypothetical protein [Candidatus Pacearchaeota archaeon]
MEKRFRFPIVPALKPLYDKYNQIQFNGASLIGSEKELSNLVETVSNDEALKNLAGISLRHSILWEIGLAENLDISPKGLLIQKYNPEFIFESKIFTKYSEVLGMLLKKFPKMNAKKLKEGVLDYISTSLYSPYSSKIRPKKAGIVLDKGISI